MKQKKDKNKNKVTEVMSTQSFCPVADVQNGIIITKDNRYVKILEITPINFSLRSADEQNGIIAAYASLLKVMPEKFQIKIVTKKAETERFISQIEEEIKTEGNANCRVLQKEQAALISRIGNEQGVTRHYYLIYEYEQNAAAGRLVKKPTFYEIEASLNYTKNRIANMLQVCGNEVAVTEDEDEAALAAIYSVMSRGQSETISFEDKCLNTMMENMSSLNDDSEKYIPISSFVSPESINTMENYKYMVVDGIYYSIGYIPSNSYPMRAVGGWMALLINAGEGVDIDFFVQKEPIAAIQRKLQYAIRYNKVKLKDTEDTSADYDDIADAVNAGYFIRQGLSDGEDFCNMATLITISAHSREELEWKVNEMRAYMLSRDLQLKLCIFKQESAFLSCLPLSKCDPTIFKKAKRNVLTSALASTYPFVSFEMSDEHGILFGVNKANNSLIFVDNFDSKRYKNANIAIMGTSGSGKTYSLQCMALRMREQKIQTFIIAPDKGHEFKRACDAIGGQYVKIAAGSGQNINIMDIRKRDTVVTELLDGDLGAKDSILSKKIQQLHIFFSLLIPDMTHEEKQQLDEALIHTYAKFGITNKNRSLNDPADPSRYRKMPVLGDLQEELKSSGAATRRLYNILNRYVIGSAKSFNMPTNVDLNNKYIVLDISELTKELLPIGMFIVLDYVWDKAREDRTKRKVIFLDELWTLIGAKSSREAAEFVLEIFKVIRGYGGAAVAATQDLNDFFALEDGRFGKGIINNAKTKIIMNLESDEAARVAETLDLTSTEVQQITRFQRGEALLAANTNHVMLTFMASKSENDLITTDRKQLEVLAQQRAAANRNK